MGLLYYISNLVTCPLWLRCNIITNLWRRRPICAICDVLLSQRIFNFLCFHFDMMTSLYINHETAFIAVYKDHGGSHHMHARPQCSCVILMACCCVASFLLRKGHPTHAFQKENDFFICSFVADPCKTIAVTLHSPLLWILIFISWHCYYLSGKLAQNETTLFAFVGIHKENKIIVLRTKCIYIYINQTLAVLLAFTYWLGNFLHFGFGYMMLSP